MVAAAATVLALVAVASCGASDDPPSAATTAPATTAAAPVEPAVLKPIDPDAFQALVDETMKDMLVPGAVVLLRTPEGDVTADLRHDRAGREHPPRRRHPLPHRLDHQDDDVGGDPAVGPGGEAEARRSGVEVRAAGARRRQHHPRPAAGDAQRALQLHRRAGDLGGHGRRPGQGLDAAGAARHRLRPAGDVRARRRVLLQQHQLRAARSDHRAVGRQAAGRVVRGAVVRAARHDRHVLPGPDSRRHPRPVLARLPVRQRRSRDDGHPVHAGDGRPRPRPGPSSRPTSPASTTRSAFAAGAVISTAADLATWMEALAGGKVLDAEYQRCGRTAPRSSTPPTRTTGTGTASTSCAGGPTPSTSTAARPPASTRRPATTPPTP